MVQKRHSLQEWGSPCRVRPTLWTMPALYCLVWVTRDVWRSRFIFYKKNKNKKYIRKEKKKEQHWMDIEDFTSPKFPLVRPDDCRERQRSGSRLKDRRSSERTQRVLRRLWRIRGTWQPAARFALRSFLLYNGVHASPSVYNSGDNQQGGSSNVSQSCSD